MVLVVGGGHVFFFFFFFFTESLLFTFCLLRRQQNPSLVIYQRPVVFCPTRLLVVPDRSLRLGSAFTIALTVLLSTMPLAAS